MPPCANLLCLWTHIRYDRVGAAALEMAYALPVFLLLLFGITEFSVRFFAEIILQSAVQEASRFGATGQKLGSVPREDLIRDIIIDSGFGLFESDQLTVTYKVYDSFDNIDKPEPFNDENGNGSYDSGESYTDINGNRRWDPDQGRTGMGTGNEIVLYEASHPWEAFTGLMEPFIGSVLSARIAVRNEPF